MGGGKLETVSGDRLLIDGRRPLERSENPYSSLSLEVLANRDSLKYIEKYKLGSQMQDMYRGTLRYHGFSDMMYGCRALGLLDNTKYEVRDGDLWSNILQKLASKNGGSHEALMNVLKSRTH